MKKPEAIVQLLEELRGENIESPVEITRESKAVLYPNDDAAGEDDGITLSSEDCALLFSSQSTVDRLLEALGDPSDASLSIFDLNLPGHILDVLEQRFVAVDEG